MKNPTSLSGHLGEIPRASSNPVHFAGIKRKHGSPKKKKNEPTQSSPSHESEQEFRKRRQQQQPTKIRVYGQAHPQDPQQRDFDRELSNDIRVFGQGNFEVSEQIDSNTGHPHNIRVFGQANYEDPFLHRRRCGLPNNNSIMVFGQANYEDLDAVACCSSSSMTTVGRFGVWYPEDSVAKEPKSLLTIPNAKELEAMYKLPRRRQREREDGAGGTLLFQIADPFTIAASKHDTFSTTMEPSGFATHTTKLESGVFEGHAFTDKNTDSRVPPSSKEGITRHAEVERSSLQDETYFETDEGLKFSGLRTGDDAIRYFTELESGGPVELVYCNRVNLVKEFAPYDLVVVPRAKVDSEHFIISAAGMVHTEPGPGNGIEGTSISLEEWLHEKNIFLSLRRIKFFGKYLIQKAFTIWRKHVGRRNFKRVRETLILKLFKGKPAFLNALLQIHGYIYDLMDLKMLLFASNRLYTMDEFLEAQSQQRHHVASPAVEACSEKVQQVLGKICQDVKKQAQIFRESVRDEHELDDVIGVNLHQPRGSKVQGMVSIRNEKIERAKTYRRVMAEEKMLGKFIRLVDYMFVESLLNRSIMSLEELYNFLEATRTGLEKSSKGVFITAVSFAEAHIAFTPNEDAIIAALGTAVEGITQILQTAPRLLYMRVYSSFFETKSFGLNPVTILRESKHFLLCRSNIEHIIRAAFVEARKYSQMFQEYRPLYLFGEAWNHETYIAEKRTVRQYREELARQREWRIDLEKMRIGCVIGVLHVDSKSLRNSLLPITTRTLDVIKGLLLAAARDETLLVLAKFQERIHALCARPAELDGFVDFIKMAIDDLSNLTMTEKEYNMRYGVWRSLNDWITMTHSWRTGHVRRLNGPEIISKTDEYAKEAYKMGKASKEDTVVFRLKDTIDDFKKVLPLIEELASEALKDRHWSQIFAILGVPYTPEAEFSVNSLLELGIMSKIEEIGMVLNLWSFLTKTLALLYWEGWMISNKFLMINS